MLRQLAVKIEKKKCQSMIFICKDLVNDGGIKIICITKHCNLKTDLDHKQFFNEKQHSSIIKL